MNRDRIGSAVIQNVRADIKLTQDSPCRLACAAAVLVDSCASDPLSVDINLASVIHIACKQNQVLFCKVFRQFKGTYIPSPARIRIPDISDISESRFPVCKTGLNNRPLAVDILCQIRCSVRIIPSHIIKVPVSHKIDQLLILTVACFLDSDHGSSSHALHCSEDIHCHVDI